MVTHWLFGSEINATVNTSALKKLLDDVKILLEITSSEVTVPGYAQNLALFKEDHLSRKFMNADDGRFHGQSWRAHTRTQSTANLPHWPSTPQFPKTKVSASS